jgi:hypothetical protein
MWGIRTICLAWLIMGVVAILGGSGCCCCPCSEKPQPETTDPANTQWKPWSYSDQPSHLTPEQIHGGII